MSHRKSAGISSAILLVTLVLACGSPGKPGRSPPSPTAYVTPLGPGLLADSVVQRLLHRSRAHQRPGTAQGPGSPGTTGPAAAALRVRGRGCLGLRGSSTEMSPPPPSEGKRAPRGGGDAYSPLVSFKGWTKPGQMDLPGIEASGLPRDGETLDALVGHYRIFQLARGNKFTNDDLLCAWYATSWCPSARRVLDLGSGLGSVAMMSAFRLQGAQFVTVEAQEVSHGLALRSARFNGLDGRFDQRLGDLRDPDVLGGGEAFDLITGTPPYFPPESGLEASQHPQKQACRFELRGTVADYCATASRHLSPGGLFVLAFPMDPPFQHERVVRGAEEAGLMMARRRPVVFREGRDPLLGLYAMVRRDDIPPDYETWVDPPLVLKRRDGVAHPEFKALQLGMGMAPW